ncbi:DUF3890 domain-containing protein [Borrelia turicatae]|uniref:DUF3890 domain-containing protein n=1 Tax=Borrelia turicatae TaxID=142 RepID=UPI002ED3AE88
MDSDVESSGNFGELYLKSKALLGITDEILSFEKFKNQTDLLGMILSTGDINIDTLNVNQVSLLIYYYIGCGLKHSDILREFGLEGKFCKDNHYGSSFEEFVFQIKTGTRKTYCIGVV